MANRWENNETVRYFIFLGSKITADGDCSREIKRHLLLGRKAMTNLDSIFIYLFIIIFFFLDSIFKKWRHHFPDKCRYSQSYSFSSTHVQMWQLDHKEGWVLKNWCLQTVVQEKILESPLDSKEVKSVNPKGNQPWIFIGRTDTEAETEIFWQPDVKSWLTGKKNLMLGKIEGRKRGWRECDG